MTRRRPPPALVAACAVAAVAAALVLPRLGEPPAIVFDETYYVPDARAMLDNGAEDGFAVHPPLGKWVIASGIATIGDEPAGWRFGGALLSVLAVAATVEIGRRLTGRLLAGAFAGVLLLLDGVWITMARLAMLDSVLAAFVTFGTLALVVDHQRATSRASDVVVSAGDDRHTLVRVAPPVSRWPLAVAGLAFGAAVATKWSGLLALGGAGLLAVGWELAAHRRRRASGGTRLVGAAVPVVAALLLLPTAVYLASWLPWLASDETGASTAAPITDLVEHHTAIASFHLDLAADHAYRAPATTWPAQTRPVIAHYESCDDTGTSEDGSPCLGPPGRASEVAVLGNPALWWSALVLVPVAATALRRRDGAAVIPLVLLGTQFVPWLVVARPVFSFYTAPLVPALTLAVAIACAELDRPARRLLALGAGAAGAGLAGGTVLLLGHAPAAAITAAVLAATGGTTIGSLLDQRREQRLGTPPAVPAGAVVALIVTVAAVAVASLLAPLWLALPVEEATLRSRWWLPSWV